ncbi:MAG: EAL domain-containing protein [Pseudomonadales bacterium]
MRIFHTSPDGILIVRNEDGVVVDFNQGFTRLFGYTREQAIGRSIAQLDLWVTEDARFQVLERLRQNPAGVDLEAQLKGADGVLRSMEISLRYVELAGELCVLCMGRDITKRLEAESAARRSEEKFARVFSESPDGIVILRQSDGVICDANDAFVRACGYGLDELLGHPMAEFDPVVEPAELERALLNLSEHGKLSNQEMLFRGKSGHLIPAILSAAVMDIDGESSLLCIVKDISELRHAQEQQRRSEERFRGAFENAPIGILLLDTRGYVFEANRFASELLQYPVAKLEGLHISRLVPPDQRAELKTGLQRLISGREHNTRGERRLVCASGVEVWTNCHIVMQRNEDGEPLYCIMQIADITEMKDSQRKMEQLAFYDTLTGLANRRLFNDRLTQAVEHCRRNRQKAALLYLDLDQFKRVNDTLGHEAGDALLREVADRLLRCVRKEDTVSRSGGDEFTILLYDVQSPSDAGFVAEKILQALREPVDISGHRLVVTPSIGIATIPSDGVEPNGLLKNADLAMYRAKENGRNNYQFYSEDLNVAAVQRLRTEYELRRALERGEFELHYQPKVRLTDLALMGVESLLRWQHPERGQLSPIEFMSVAEETGVIVDIGAWILEEACRAGQVMIDQRGAPLSIAVNISPRQFRDPNLVTTIRRCVRESGLDPACLELEITETMLMHDVELAAETIRRLSELGIRLAIDDFGTGYSSLNYLKKFPISTVKVDRSFISDIPGSADDVAITSAVIAMAHRLNMEVVAEGVETREQLEFLQEQQCEYGQGYLFSRAQPLSEMRRMLSPRLRLLRGA